MRRSIQKRKIGLATVFASTLLWGGQSHADNTFKIGSVEGSANLQVGGVAISAKGVNFGLGQIDSRSGVNKGTDANWLETFVKPSLNLNYRMSDSIELLAGGSIINTHTFGDGDAGGFTRGGDGTTSLEDLYAGFRYKDWRLTAGRQQYVIGNGFLIADGHLGILGEGAYWSDPRRAFKDAVILRYEGNPLSVQAFTIRTDRHLGESRMSGFNVDYALSFAKPGATFFAVDDVDPAAQAVAPKDGMRVYDIRLLDLKIPQLPDLKLDAEYAIQRGSGKGVKFDASAWYVQGAYAFSAMPLKPTLTYRYAKFSGDSDPSDGTRNSWDPLAKGYMQRGAWVIGDITGMYLLNNSNETVHLWNFGVPVTPALGVGVTYYRFGLDKANYYGTPVSSKSFSDETAIYMDWAASKNFYLTVSYNYARPKTAAKEVLGDKNFSALQLYASYTF